MDQTNVAMNGVWSAVRALLIAVGSALVTGGVISKTSAVYFWIMLLAGSVMVIGPAGYNLYCAITAALRVRQTVAQAVGAGINLVVSGKALAVDGTVIGAAGASSSSTPPLPVTLDSAAKIVKDFAPTKKAT